jgi:hypothetical protein
VPIAEVQAARTRAIFDGEAAGAPELRHAA